MAFREAHPEFLIDDVTGALGYKRPATALDMPAGGVQFAYDASGNVEGIAGPGGSIIKLGASPSGHLQESQFTAAFLQFPPPRQINAVKDLGPNLCDGAYMGALSDADVYDSFAAYTPASGSKPTGNFLATGYTNTSGTLSTSSSKALLLPKSKFNWDLNAGQSLLIQQCFMIPDNGTAATWNGSTYLFGTNTSSLTTQGFSCYVGTNGALNFGYKVGAVAASGVIGSATFQPSAYPVTLNTRNYLTLYIDGNLKQINIWLNGIQNDSQTNKLILPDSGGNYSTLYNGAGLNLGIGCGIDASTSATTTSNAKPLFTSHFRATVLPAGMSLVAPGRLDFLFNRDPNRFFSDYDMVGAF